MFRLTLATVARNMGNLFAGVLVLAHSGCAGMQRPPRDIAVPADAVVVPPDNTIPKNIAAYSGKWHGAWYGDKTGTYMADQVVVVERITSPTSARVTYAGIGRWGQLNGQPWVNRLDGTFSNDALQFTLPSGVVVTLRMNGNGTLDANGSGSGGTWRGTFARSSN